jgi:glycosyltransferase involved in cell wall biosynthesis
MLSVLLPVYNAHSNLEWSVCEILEVLPELAERFELCILDDGSTDDTVEVAHELAGQFPQVLVVRHPVRLGLAEAIQSGLDHTEGELILIGDSDYSLDPNDLRTLWQLRDLERQRASYGRPGGFEDDWIERLRGWKPRRSARSFQLIRRATFEQYRLQHLAEIITRVDRLQSSKHNGPPSLPLRPNFLGKVKNFAWRE